MPARSRGEYAYTLLLLWHAPPSRTRTLAQWPCATDCSNPCTRAARRSVIELARMRGYTVLEEPVSISEAMDADELFTTGTAVVCVLCAPACCMRFMRACIHILCKVCEGLIGAN